MNSKRKADLQRKLSLARVPTPPAGLAERLKNDIPNYLVATPEKERERLSKSVALNLRVAASILLMISSVYLMLHLVSRSENKTVDAALSRAPVVAAEKSAPSNIDRVAQTTAPVAPPTVVVLGETTVVARRDRTEESPATVQPSPTLGRQELAAAKASQPQELAPELSRPSEAITITAAAPLAPAENIAAPSPAPPPPAAMQARASAAPAFAAPMQERRSSRAAAGGAMSGLMGTRDLVKSAKAADLTFAPPEALFGISVDRRAFDRIKNAIERGERPETATIDVDALVNYFAGRAPHPPRELEIEAEGSPAPVPVDRFRQIVRFTVDAAAADVANGGSVLPVASDARIEIRFDPHSVASHRRIGGDDVIDASQPTLLKNASVTALYEIELQPNVGPRQTIVRLRLTYRSATDGRERTIERTLLRQNLARTWVSASRRHRLASLGAIWGESLKGNAAGIEVAQRAEELAHQAPNDSKARELADVAGALSRLSNTGATGSGR